MTKIWDEPFDFKRHRNHMPEVGGELDSDGSVIIVECGRYRLEFLSVVQLETAIDYFRSKTHPSTRMNASGGSHWEFQPWHCRLPPGVGNSKNRPRVLKALKAALVRYAAGASYRPACR